MVFKTLGSCLCFAFYIFRVASNPIFEQSNDANDLVPIPGGMIEKSRVHIVPEGGQIVHSPTEVRLLDADGRVLHISATAPSNNTISIYKKPNTEPVLGPRNLQAATILAAAQAPSVSSFGSNWILPPLPQVNSGQLLMYSSILAPTNIDAVIQPTLQYGVSAAGGGPFWSVASWYITSQQAFVTNLTKLTQAPGLTLSAFIINQDQFHGTPTTHSWLSVFQGFQQTAMNIQTSENLDVAMVALQITGATTIDNLPTGPTDVQRIVILTAPDDKTFFPIPWVFSNDTADGITINRIPNAISSNEVLFFKYGQA